MFFFYIKKNISYIVNEEDGEPIFEQSSYSDLVDKYYLDTNLTCDVNISKSNPIDLFFFLAKIRQ